VSKVQVAPTKKLGRKSKYDSAKLPEVLELASRNQPQAVIAAKVFGCGVSAFKEYVNLFPALAAALKDGRQEYFDTTTPEIEDALARNAKGECIVERWTTKDGEEHERYNPPNTAAQIFWLVNMSRRMAALAAGVKDVAEWEQTQRFEHTGKDGGPIAMSLSESAALMNGRVIPKAGE
jgi:hypothetical protein